MFIVVKGDEAEAQAACAVRGIPATLVSEHSSMLEPTYRMVRLRVPDSYWNDVAEWFISDKSGPPYPVGSCLHYGSES